MLKIWGRTTSINVQKVLWCCAELDLKYERVDAGGKFGVNNTPEYLAMNPERAGADDPATTVSSCGSPTPSCATSRASTARARCGRTTTRSAPTPTAGWSGTRTTLWNNLRPVFWNLVRVEPDKRDMKLVEESRKKMADNLKIVENNSRQPALRGGQAHSPWATSRWAWRCTAGSCCRSSAPTTPGSRRTTSGSSSARASRSIAPRR